jgi:hypothetical protein
VTSPQVLFGIGKTWGDVKVVPDGGLAGIPDGPDLFLLTVSVAPYPVPVNRPASVTFIATDSSGGAAAGSVKENRTVIGRTNTAISHTFRATRKRIGDDWELVYPTVTVSVPGFPETDVDCGW